MPVLLTREDILLRRESQMVTWDNQHWSDILNYQSPPSVRARQLGINLASQIDQQLLLNSLRTCQIFKSKVEFFMNTSSRGRVKTRFCNFFMQSMSLNNNNRSYSLTTSQISNTILRLLHAKLYSYLIFIMTYERENQKLLSSPFYK